MENDYADPAAVLKFDCARVAIGAFGDADMLDNLNQFAFSLKYYADMVKENLSAASRRQQEIAAETTEDRNLHDPVGLLEYDPAGVAIRTKGNAQMLSQIVHFATQLEGYVQDVQAKSVEQSGQSASQSNDTNSLPATPDVPTRMTANRTVSPAEGTTDESGDNNE